MLALLSQANGNVVEVNGTKYAPPDAFQKESNIIRYGKQSELDAKMPSRVADANDGVAFDDKQTSICRSADVQKKSKGLVWQTVKRQVPLVRRCIDSVACLKLSYRNGPNVGSYLVTK